MQPQILHQVAKFATLCICKCFLLQTLLIKGFLHNSKAHPGLQRMGPLLVRRTQPEHHHGHYREGYKDAPADFRRPDAKERRVNVKC